MAKFIYPNEDDLRYFISLITGTGYRIKKYLPKVSDEWYKKVSECIEYVEHTSEYEGEKSIEEISARLLYKIAKRHELGDGNKRSAVICVFIFCLLNNYYIINPQIHKDQAKRAASTKGRTNEEAMKKKISDVLKSNMEILPEEKNTP